MLAVIGNLVGSASTHPTTPPKADRLLIAGGMAYTFLAAQGHRVGDSMLQADQIPQVTAVLADAARAGVELVLPVDHVVADRFAADARPEVVPGPDIPDGTMGLDIGPATIDLFGRKLADAKTVFWNGPPGVFEFPAFAAGTLTVAEAISHVIGLTVVGGGDSAAAVRHLNLPADAFTHISTGGGALPGRAARRRAHEQGKQPDAADRWQLEDALQPPGSARPGAEDRLRAQAPGLRGHRGGGAATVHRAAQRADPGDGGQAGHPLRRAGHLAARRRRLHR